MDPSELRLAAVDWTTLRRHVRELASQMDADFDQMDAGDRERLARVALAVAHLAQTMITRSGSGGYQWWNPPTSS
ncbi:hypothetical protein [Streptomyces iranensis]|uniref:Uncharacterized protein n=1 Tax=Streptomyces iranensis TaxID=576784 RepID=A0A060ZUD5_9ACTN|nr:hypothetical protein [Streptomyces iranensis]MBP2061713.1 hypothetical protein [Streptomyces iranensis]CDR09461.1 predicted protein [Streptomyces iranensis]